LIIIGIIALVVSAVATLATRMSVAAHI
jgi:hypothetical protein